MVTAMVLSLLLLLVLSLYLYLLRKTSLEESGESDPVVHIISAPVTTFSAPPQQTEQSEQLAGIFTRKIWPDRARVQPTVKILEM